MIEFDNITFIYDNKPLMQHFSCCISSGEKVVLYGPSGHGKSTLLASVSYTHLRAHETGRNLVCRLLLEKKKKKDTNKKNEKKRKKK